jgi:hypothetical protein
MKVYLASWFASKDEMNVRADELRASGLEVTSRWLEERVKPTVTIAEVADEYLRETAQIDIEDILLANYLVLNVPSEADLKTVNIPISSWARGGRHFEAGFQYATMLFHAYLPQVVKKIGARGMILVGHRENVFHYLDGVNKALSVMGGFSLPEIPVFETWEEAKTFLVNQASQTTAAGM